MAKVKVRTKQGGFKDDRFHLTTKWQDVDEADISPLWVDSPNIEIKMPDGKFLPNSVVETRPVMTRPEPVKEEEEETEEPKAPAKPEKDADKT